MIWHYLAVVLIGGALAWHIARGGPRYALELLAQKRASASGGLSDRANKVVYAVVTAALVATAALLLVPTTAFVFEVGLGLAFLTLGILAFAMNGVRDSGALFSFGVGTFTLLGAVA
ncbi:hypothetical protein [Qipengyuania flava]|uniref:hypothetical protein n=1 Tax=Qipengyuania flava TaxID=192812 RepID=UPI001C63A593|nr:hypothetical protein [Qipengyuania flava]QYJ07520.1 hypothetical protein KUV82_01990 [Qipengyuania flava]